MSGSQPHPDEGSGAASPGPTVGTILVAYLATTYVLFVSWRSFELASAMQAAFVLLYALSTLSALHLAGSMRALPAITATPIALLGMLAYPILFSRAGPWAIAPLVLLAAWGGYSALPMLRRSLDWRIAAAAGLGILVAAIEFYAVNSRIYAFIYSDEALAAGTMFRDTLFHSAIINLIREQGVASTGLDGLPPLTYYVGVHRWVAGIAEIVSGNAALTLAMTAQLFTIPMTVYGFLRAVRSLQTGVSQPLLLAVASLAVFLVAQSTVASTFLVSESYSLSLVLMFSALPIGMKWLADGTRVDRSMLPEVAVAVLLVIATGYTKVSTAFALVAFFIACMFVCVYRHRPVLAAVSVLIAGTLCAAICLLLYLFYFDPAYMPVQLFHFSDTYASVWYRYLAAMALCAAIFGTLWAASFDASAHAFAAIVTVVISCVPPQMFAFASQGGSYFIQPALLIAISLTMFSLARFVLTKRIAILPAPVVAGVVALFVIVAGLSLLVPGLRAFEKRVASHQRALAKVAKQFAGTPFGGTGKPLPLVQIANRISEKKDEGHDRPIVYVPPDNAVIWNETGDVCWTKSFAIPALTGLPLLAGVRGTAVGCVTTPYYGMNAYGPAAQNRTLKPDEICIQALTLGFDVVYSLDAGVDVNRLDCAAIAANAKPHATSTLGTGSGS